MKPTLLVTLVGIIDDVRKAVSTDFLAPGDLIYVVGGTGGALGASILERVLAGWTLAAGAGRASLGVCPVADPAAHLPAYRALAKAISGKVVRSCHDLSDGGLAVALAESCLGGRLGASVRLDALPPRSDRTSWRKESQGLPAAARALFAEDPGRLLVSIRPEDRERFERGIAGLPCRLVGEATREPRLRATFAGRAVLDAALPALEQAFKTPIA